MNVPKKNAAEILSEMSMGELINWCRHVSIHAQTKSQETFIQTLAQTTEKYYEDYRQVCALYTDKKD